MLPGHLTDSQRDFDGVARVSYLIYGNAGKVLSRSYTFENPLVWREINH